MFILLGFYSVLFLFEYVLCSCSVYGISFPSTTRLFVVFAVRIVFALIPLEYGFPLPFGSLLAMVTSVETAAESHFHFPL